MIPIKLVYIAHPFEGKPENVEKVQAIILKLIHKYPDISPYSPLHATGFFYHEFTYGRGMEHCFEALKRCDELWLCDGWLNSKGCKLELEYVLKIYPIPVCIVSQNGDVKSVDKYTASKLLHAAETLCKHCNEQEECEGCFFNGSDGCYFESKPSPDTWKIGV